MRRRVCLPPICTPGIDRSPISRIRRPLQLMRTRSRSVVMSTLLSESLPPLARRDPDDTVEATVSPTLSAIPDTTRHADRSPSFASEGMVNPPSELLSAPGASSSEAPCRGPGPQSGPLVTPDVGWSCPAAAIRRLASAVSILPAARSSRIAVMSALMTSTLRGSPTG
ncbi:hypothetical protein HMPREF9207_0050 [Cutibacterium acnes J165]|nr:hypothetical protein HMPREF9207_0050 [Cutibacterium acnes J165]MCW5107044.1 hypothetical protein [Cutibacterium acnes P07A]